MGVMKWQTNALKAAWNTIFTKPDRVHTSRSGIEQASEQICDNKFSSITGNGSDGFRGLPRPPLI